MDKTTNFPTILPPTGLLIAILLMVGLHFFLPLLQIVPTFWRLSGLMPLAVGLIISYAAEGQFRTADTTVQPFKNSQLLVTDGLYRFSRNPMYLGMVLVIIGAALLLGSLTPFGFIIVFVGWIRYRFILREEAMLNAQFGQEWLEYKERVRRWL
jgi:protein-S-isoprenylcysteine O-methyltransferase Ste14